MRLFICKTYRVDTIEFKQRFLPCSQRMYASALRLTGNTQEAEDLVQETFLRLWVKRNSLPELQSDEAFCLITMRNLFLDTVRRRHLVEAEQEVSNFNISEQETVTQGIDERDTVNQVKSIISRLPEKQRRVITLRDVEGYSFKEIQQITGLSDINMRVLLSRARKTVKMKMTGGKSPL